MKVDRKPFTVLTFNVLPDPEQKRARTGKALEAIREENADVVALQGVRPWFTEGLLADRKIHEQYPYQNRAGGLLLLSRFPIDGWGHNTLPESSFAEVVYTKIHLPGDPQVLWLAIVELSVALEVGARRAKQLQAVQTALAAYPQAMILGSLNFGDRDQRETEALADDYADAWRAANPNRPGYTVNLEENWLARGHAMVGESSRRLDRILLRSPHYHVVDAKLFGHEPLDLKLYPDRPAMLSNHYGVHATIAPASGSKSRAPTK